MAKVSERCHEVTGHTAIICDFSPPRSGDPSVLQQADIAADFISVAYNPGRAVRVNPAMLAASIKQRAGKDVLFTLATRDMNRLALQSLLLGAQLQGLDNVVVVQGDPFSQRDREMVHEAADLRPTELIASIAELNAGVDFRGSSLRSPTDFCVGATLDLSRGMEKEAGLAYRKVQAGAQFLMSQPIFDVEDAARFRDSYATLAGAPMNLPVFFGLQVLEQDGVIFSSVPPQVRQELEQGRPGVEIALELYGKFQESGLHNVYLVPPIRRGGARNYDAAREFLASAARV